MSTPSLRARCAQLLQHGSLPASACSAALRHFLQPLLDAGVIVDERAGPGRRLAVRDTPAAHAFITGRFPDAPELAPAADRIASVAGFRDSKAFGHLDAEIVTLRAWGPRVLQQAGQWVDAAGATRAHGVFSFLLEPNSSYTLAGAAALVENLSVFRQGERLQLPVSLALWGRGRCSAPFLDWLAANVHPQFTLLHLPDYDPVGLSEFLRLHRRLGPRVRLHLPPDLPQRFARYSNPRLLDHTNSRALLGRLRSDPPPPIRQVLELIDRHNAGLEQEALLVPQ